MFPLVPLDKLFTFLLDHFDLLIQCGLVVWIAGVVLQASLSKHNWWILVIVISTIAWFLFFCHIFLIFSGWTWNGGNHFQFGAFAFVILYYQFWLWDHACHPFMF